MPEAADHHRSHTTDAFEPRLDDSWTISHYMSSFAGNESFDRDMAHEHFRGTAATLTRFAIADLVEGDENRNVRSAKKDKAYAQMDAETSPPIIVEGGQVMDGNHRLRASIKRGDKFILGYDVHDADEHPEPFKGSLNPTGDFVLIPPCIEPLARLVAGKTFENAKRAIVAQIGSVQRGERFDDDVADSVFLRLQQVAQVGRYLDERDLAYRGARRLEGEGTIKLYRSAPPDAGIRPGDFAASNAAEARFYKHGSNVVQSVTVPRGDVIAVNGSTGGAQEYVLLPKGHVAPDAVEHFASFRDFYNAANDARLTANDKVTSARKAKTFIEGIEAAAPSVASRLKP